MSPETDGQTPETPTIAQETNKSTDSSKDCLF
jgi:hypothetical protein